MQEAGIKLASIATDVLGLSGQAMLEALIGVTTDPNVLAELARGRLRTKLPARQAHRHGEAPFAEDLARLDARPGVNKRTAEVILAEIGMDMHVFRARAIWRVGPGSAR